MQLVTTRETDFAGFKARLKRTWMSGDFGQIAKHIEGAAAHFISRCGIRPKMHVLDVACGTGDLAIPAAKAGAVVTGIDLAPNLLKQARARAKREGVKVRLDEGDAENLPYHDASFDVVVSLFGAMLAPRPDQVAAELTRVCRPGGRIALASWTPRGFVGEMMQTTARHVPPPAVPPPELWGDETTVRERLGTGIGDLAMTPVTAQLKFPFSVPETVELYRTWFGPTKRAFASLPQEEQEALREDLEDLMARHNKACDGTTHIEAEYLEVVAIRS